MQPQHLSTSHQPNPAFEGTRVVHLCASPSLHRRAPQRGRWARSRMSKSASGGQVRRETSGRSCCARFGMVAVWSFAELGRVGRADGSIVSPTTPQDNLKSHA